MQTNHVKNISYITDMANELEKMAATTQNRFLALLFKMAAQEGKEMMRVGARPNEGEEIQNRPGA